MQYAAADGLPASIADSVAGNDVVAVMRRGTVIGYYFPVQRPDQPESNTEPHNRADDFPLYSR